MKFFPKILRLRQDKSQDVISNVFDQNADTNAESFGNAPQSDQRDMLFTPLNPPNIVRVKIGLFGKTLLAQTTAQPLFADRRTEDNSIIRHSLTRKQTLPDSTTPLNG